MLAAPTEFMGVRIKRREDPALITGAGKYTADIQLPNMLYMAVVRSPHAHARLNGIDASAALALPGVVAVLTAADLHPHLKKKLPMIIEVQTDNYTDQKDGTRYPLAVDKVCYVGDPLALIIAENRYVAADALDLVQVDYDPLPAVVDPEAGLQADSPLIHEAWGTNLGFRWVGGSGDVDAAFAQADKVVEARIRNQRLIPNAMEPRAAVASYDAASGVTTLWTTTQVPHGVQDDVSAIFGMDKAQLRVIAPEVGGGFGAKLNIYSEEVAAVYLTQKFRRPIKWVATRSEDIVCTSHGRDQVDVIRLAATKDGRVLAADLKVIADCGAYYSRVTPGVPPLTGLMMTGVYDIPAARAEVLGVMTNKSVMEPYRGAGRPEAAYLIERAMDVLADELGMDPVEVRRRNFIPPDKFPYKTPTGALYDSGEYNKPLSKLLELINYPALRAEQAQRLQNGGKLLGIGIGCYVEICGLGPWEAGIITMDQEGKVTILTGTSPHGQGHHTAWAQIAAGILQVPPEDITVKHGDTAVVPRGVGTFGSRSAPVGGSAVYNNSITVRNKARDIAAHLLEAAAADITLTEGRFHVVGSPSKGVTWREVAQAAYSGNLPDEVSSELKAEDDFQHKGDTYPFGAHACIVEIDRATGQVDVVRYVTVDDCGPVINPLLVDGQVHGGLAQGIGQVMIEGAIYDEIGQLVTGSFMDYAMPRADNFPRFETNRTETPSPFNPLGVKGIGEAATIGSTPTVSNAVVDALAHLGVRHVDMPYTTEKIWRILHP